MPTPDESMARIMYAREIAEIKKELKKANDRIKDLEKEMEAIKPRKELHFF